MMLGMFSVTAVHKRHANVHLTGGGYHGNRISKPYRESVGEDEIIEIMQRLIKRYATERLENEHFGDFTVRIGEIAATTEGKHFVSLPVWSFLICASMLMLGLFTVR